MLMWGCAAMPIVVSLSFLYSTVLCVGFRNTRAVVPAGLCTAPRGTGLPHRPLSTCESRDCHLTAMTSPMLLTLQLSVSDSVLREFYEGALEDAKEAARKAMVVSLTVS